MNALLKAHLLLGIVALATKPESKIHSHLRQRSLGGSPRWAPENFPPSLLQRFNQFPPAAQTKILNTFKAMNLDAKVDGAFVDIDDNADIRIADPPPPEQYPIADGGASGKEYPQNAPVQASGVPIYHSKPGAPYTLYLDFDGHSWIGHAWANGAFIDAKPYDTDGSPSSYSASELDLIGNTWAIVAEDFAPFDIDVTTEEPLSLTNNVGHVLMTDTVDKNGVTIYNCGCGGVAYVNVFKASNYASYYSPALVFNKGLSGVAEAVSHEFGHNLGLYHDGTSTTGYYEGHGTGETDWAPIMGVGYYANTVQWSKGEYSGANNKEDDLAIISAKVPYRPDDNTADTPLIFIGNKQWRGEGLIERNTDEDSFTFSVGAVSDVTILVDTRANRYGNLDAGFRIVDLGTGNIIATVETPNDRQATWTGSLPQATYKVVVYGTSNGADATVGYSKYGSLGQYEVLVSNLDAPPQCTAVAECPQPSLICQTVSCDSNQCLYTSLPNCCGNGICEASAGETCQSCQSDCGVCECTSDATCQAKAGTCQTGTCNNFKCTITTNSNCCGNGQCEANVNESCSTCSLDCACCTGLGATPCKANASCKWQGGKCLVK